MSRAIYSTHGCRTRFLLMILGGVGWGFISSIDSIGFLDIVKRYEVNIKTYEREVWGWRRNRVTKRRERGRRRNREEIKEKERELGG